MKIYLVNKVQWINIVLFFDVVFVCINVSFCEPIHVTVTYFIGISILWYIYIRIYFRYE
jgi:hypothetical protein